MASYSSFISRYAPEDDGRWPDEESELPEVVETHCETLWVKSDADVIDILAVVESMSLREGQVADLLFSLIFKHEGTEFLVEVGLKRDVTDPGTLWHIFTNHEIESHLDNFPLCHSTDGMTIDSFGYAWRTTLKLSPFGAVPAHVEALADWIYYMCGGRDE